jgi:ABC-type branched-subunit amino acid transport system ATPase component
MEKNIPCITKNLDAGYGGVAYIRNINIQVGKNEKVAIIGPNGAGKNYNHEHFSWNSKAFER